MATWHTKLAIALGGVLLLSGTVASQNATFGAPEDVEFAATLWDALNEQRLAGDNAIHAKPYEGTEPHGAMLETFNAMLDVEGTEAQVIVKRNYAPAGLSASEVWSDPSAHLDSVTVMLADEDAESGWFWAKYLPDGSLDQTPDSVSMAGQVGGCVACHEGAGGGDMVFTND